MSQYLVDTEIKLGQCNRCESYVFMAMSSGVRSAADPAPADRDAYIAALTDGRRVFRRSDRAGRPWKLRSDPPRWVDPSFDAGGAQTAPGDVLVEHGCGGHQRNMLTFTEVAPGPPSPPARHGSSGGGSLLQAALGGGRIESLPARPATRPRSDTNLGTSTPSMAPQTAWEAVGGLPGRMRAQTASDPRGESWTGRMGSVRCHICDRIIDQSEPFAGIHHGRWVWAVHEECP